MRYRSGKLGVLARALIILALIAVSGARGDSLTVSVYKDSYVLYEPLVVDVVLHLDDPFMPGMDDPYKALEQVRRLHRRLYVELRDHNGDKMSRALLCGTEFRPSEEPCSEFRATGLAIPQAPERGGEFVPWEGIGPFLLVLQDYERGLESNSILVSIKSPTGSATPAAQMFKQCGADMLAPLLGERPHDTESKDLFRRLAAEYGDTPYGKYAMVSLALVRYRSTFAEHNNKGGASVWDPVVADLAKAVEAFSGWHPLREKALFHLAVAEALAGNYASAKQHAGVLAKEFPSGEYGTKGNKLIAEIANTERTSGRENDGE